ncbi:hypothetical protein AVEN_203717-1 [Araneus ventricosus]|uniref:Uncharacterized protein n=1 Tax=Araneus ventricosus TaxID=182803 RepID=A0A4Y2IQS3_ARAVE|nr:hypothetical protein AVEN_203717-1 [Araneus ventricosus]
MDDSPDGEWDAGSIDGQLCRRRSVLTYAWNEKIMFSEASFRHYNDRGRDPFAGITGTARPSGWLVSEFRLLERPLCILAFDCFCRNRLKSRFAC